MLRYLFDRLWKNPLARIGTLVAISVIVFALIFSARQSLYLFFSRLFSSPNWSDVREYAGKPFAFEENAKSAQAKTKDAWSALYNLAREKTNAAKIDTPLFHGEIQTRPFANFLDKRAEETIFVFLNAMAKNCGPLFASTQRADNETAAGEVADAASIEGRLRKAARETTLALVRIHAQNILPALEKKPDFVPAIELSHEIFRASCNIRETASLYARALDYREYALQKNLYAKDNGKLYTRFPEEFDARSHEALQRDKAYHDLWIRYFEAIRFRTPYAPGQIYQLRNAYAKIKNAATLQALVQALLAEARHTNAETAKKCHYELFALDYPGVADDANYVFALAETAYRGREFARAQNIIKNALQKNLVKDSALRRDLEQMAFGIELELHDSENFSRF